MHRLRAELDRLRAFAERGPAFGALGHHGDLDWSLWHRAAESLNAALAGAPDLDRRIHHLYLPVFFFCLARRRAATTAPVLVGLQAPQGAGKTTLVTHLLNLFPLAGLRAAAVSIDDFYLTRTEQLALAAAHPGNPYLEHRGYPGTHDVVLGADVLRQLRGLGHAPADAEANDAPDIRVPVYDKSAHGGRGDRAPSSEWRRVTAPVDVVLVEGWMLGFEPVDPSGIVDARLLEPNRRLRAYETWTRALDAFVMLRAEDASYVLTWRVEAEASMKAAGQPGLDRAAILDYVRRFLPAYALYAGRIPPVLRDRSLTIVLDARRGPV